MLPSSTTARVSFHALLAALATAVVCFLGATLFTQLTSRAILSSAEGVSDDAMPSIEEIAEARYALTSFQEAAHSASGDSDSAAAFADEARSARAAVDDAFHKYRALPLYPGEEVVATDTESALANLWATFDAQRAAGIKGSAAMAELTPAIKRADRALSRIQKFNAAYARIYAEEVERLYRRSTFASVLLNGISVGLTFLVAFLAWRAIRVQSRLDERRVAELELFAGRVAHDLRNPIAALSLGLDIVQRAVGGDERLSQTVDRMKRSLARSGGIMDALLEFARAGARPNAMATADLDAMISEALETAEAGATGASIELSREGESGLAVACAPGILASVLSNLLENAIKYMGSARERRVIVRTSKTGARPAAVPR